VIIGVLSVVHHTDDVRIREKLIPTLSRDFEVEYHSRTPGPSVVEGFAWHPIRGPRIVRNLSLAARLWTRPFDVAVLVDPETFLAGIIASRRTKVVFDIHENLPAQILTKRLPLNKLVARLARVVLKAAERAGRITLAEPGYSDLFSGDHPVFENYPCWDSLPSPGDSDGSVVYIGDITEQRGALDLAEAAGAAGLDLVMVGRCSPDLAVAIEQSVTSGGGTVEMTGRLPWHEAMERLATAAVAVSPLRDTPNYHNSLPTKVLEYLGMGVPVVATDLPGTAHVLRGRPGVWLVPAGDVAALRNAILDADNEASREAARAAAETIRSEYEWPTERVRLFYAGVAGSPGLNPDR
jgi:glycosyltransferase involved in cell wall biosynthesis